MKYSEFKAEVEKLGYIVKNKNEAHIYVSDADGLTIARVGKLHAVEMATDFMKFTTITRLEHKLLIYTHCKNLAETPLAEREEEKLYRVKFPTITRGGNAIYLQRDTGKKDPIGIDWSPEDFIFDEKPTDYIFTEQEIKDIDERYLAFKVEVKDE